MWHNSLPSSQLCINMIGILLYCDSVTVRLWQDNKTISLCWRGGGRPVQYQGIYYFSSWQSYVVGDREKYWLIGDSDLVIRADIVMMVPHPLLSIDLLLNTGSVHQPNQPLEVVLCRIIKVINILNNIQQSNIGCPFALFINQLVIMYIALYTWLKNIPLQMNVCWTVWTTES